MAVLTEQGLDCIGDSSEVQAATAYFDKQRDVQLNNTSECRVLAT